MYSNAYDLYSKRVESFNPYKPIVLFCGKSVTRAKPDQTPQKATSGQVLLNLLTEVSFNIWIKWKIPPNNPYIENRPIPLITLGQNIRHKWVKVRKVAKIRNRYNQVPHLNQDTTWESDKTQLNITNESQEVSPFPTGGHKAAMNRRAWKYNTRQK